MLAVVQAPNQPSIRVTERLGMVPEGRTTRFYGRELELFSIELAPGPATPRPHLRRAGVADAAAIGALHVRAWQWAYRDLVPQSLLDGLSVDRRTALWHRTLSPAGSAERVWLAHEGGVLVGFAATAPTRDPDAAPRTGELTAIYIEEPALGAGAGRALIRRALLDLDSRGFARATLWVLDTNARGRRFYERGGCRADGATKQDPRDGATLSELRYAIELGPAGALRGA